MTTGRSLALVLLGQALAASLLLETGIAAERYPVRPMRMIVPFPPGGGTDIMGRLMAAKLSESLGVQVVVDNRGGAGGIIGTELAARANPDGHTLLLGSVSTISINPSLYKKLPFDTLKDLAPISLMASTPSVLVVSASLPVKSVQELIALAKSKPGQLNFASAGIGTSHHLGGELFRVTTGIDVVHVPYKGTAPAVTDLVAGRASMMIANMPAVLPMIKAQKLRPLAVTSLQRSPLMAELPTVAGSGVPGFEVIIWYGVLAPAGTPKPLIARLSREVGKVVAMPDVVERLAVQGAEAVASTPEAFAKRIRDDMGKWGKIVKISGARPE